MNFLKDFQTEVKVLVGVLAIAVLIVGGVFLLTRSEGGSQLQSVSNNDLALTGEEPLQLTEGNGRIETAPESFILDGYIEEWIELPHSLLLSDTDSKEREGIVWVGQSTTGIIIAGKVLGNPPQWTEGENISVWLSDREKVEMPPIGWGNQFGFIDLQTINDCESKDSEDVSFRGTETECKGWFKQQEEYREPLKKLFTRHWQIAPNTVKEVYATLAFNAIDDSLKENFAILEPSQIPEVRIQESNQPNKAYSFEILIPWEVFPPISSLRMQSISLLVDISNRAGSPDAPIIFDLLSFENPKEYSLTSCGYDLEGFDILTYERIGGQIGVSWKPLSENAHTYFFPRSTSIIQTVFSLDNAATGYAYKPTGYSPIVINSEYFEVSLGEDEIICGPEFVYVKGEKTITSNTTIEDSRILTTRKLPNGDYLIRRGPVEEHSAYGSGQCGACPRISSEVYYLDVANETLAQAFRYYDVVGNQFNDIDIFVSDDWSEIEVYENQWNQDYTDTTWNLKVYCYEETQRKYTECAQEDSVQEPSPRNLRIGGYLDPVP